MTSANVLYTDLSWTTVQRAFAGDAVANAVRGGYSVHASPPFRFQCSLTDEVKPRVVKVLKDPDRPSSRGLQVSLRSRNQLAFFEELQNQIIMAMFTNAERWFGKSLPLADVRYMFKRLVLVRGRSDTVVLRLPASASLFVYNEEGACVAGDLDELREGLPVVPIVEVLGLWVDAERFGVCARVTDVLAFPYEECDDGSSVASGNEGASAASGPDFILTRPELYGLDALWSQAARDEPLGDDAGSWNTKVVLRAVGADHTRPSVFPPRAGGPQPAPPE